MRTQPSRKLWPGRSGIRLISAFLLTLCLITGTVTAAGTISIDTSSLTSTPVGTTVQIPVKITGASDVSSYQLHINTGTTDQAVIQFNPASVADKITNDTTGNIIWMGRMQGYPSISGDATLFSLDVTPKTAGTIDLSITVVEVFEGTTTTPAAGYTGSSASLIATGAGGGGGGSSSGGDSSDGSSSPGTSGTTASVGTTGTATTSPSVQTETPATNGTHVSTVIATVAATTATQTATHTTTTEPVKTPASLLAVLAGLGIAGLLTQRKSI